MLFNSYFFLLAFLPVSVAVYVCLRRRSIEASLLWLNGCSFFFYGWANPAYLPLLFASITVNFMLGKKIAATGKSRTSNWLVFAGIALNLLALAYFKYTGFALANLNAWLGTGFNDPGIMLPLAISFFTFNQITYLLDAWEGLAEEYCFNHYCLFVSFFPHLLAGPMVHHRELIPQFSEQRDPARVEAQWAVGITVISFGLFKKVVFADSLAYYADQVFGAASQGIAISATEAWIGALAYTLQIYFDFSAYCDIAYGAALLFGICLPQNFLSPYKAASIIDFWKQWHITLGRIINTYVYNPLMRHTRGGISFTKAMLVTVFSMTICGVWHGAGWHFIAWGFVQGILLVINHLWRKTALAKSLALSTSYFFFSVLLTYTAITVSTVLSRAPDMATATAMYTAMFDVGNFGWSHNIHQPVISDLARQAGITLSPMMKLLPVLILLQCWVWLMPNLQQLMKGYDYATTTLGVPESRLKWQPNLWWGALTALALVFSFMALYQTGEFIYFQF